jgi:hypothetical protein
MVMFILLNNLTTDAESVQGGWLLGRATLLKGATPVIISILRIVTVVTDLFSGNNCYCIN